MVNAMDVGQGLVAKRTILLATDGKPHSEKAENYAIEFAKLSSSKMFVLYAINPKGNDNEQELMNEGSRRLNALKERANAAGVDVTTLIEGGIAYSVILAVADRIKAGTIVVGTSGKNILDRVFIGSVSEYVREERFLPGHRC